MYVAVLTDTSATLATPFRSTNPRASALTGPGRGGSAATRNEVARSDANSSAVMRSIVSVTGVGGRRGSCGPALGLRGAASSAGRGFGGDGFGKSGLRRRSSLFA